MARQIRQVSVTGKTQLSPNMQRVQLSGEALSPFPEGFDGGYIKLVFDNSGERPLARSYTIRRFDPTSRTLTLDMVAHGDAGPAARWANRVTVGDNIDILGPGACRRLNLDADWFLLAGDMSALPAICVNLEHLPPQASGYVIVEVMSEADCHDLAVPPGMELQWVINPEPDAISGALADRVRSLPWQDGRVSAWVAGEFNASRSLRQYLRHERQVPRDFMYVSSYWKVGETDEGMKAAKKADVEAW